ncbi:MAG: transcriptional regulator [Candidatus Melainabacteria bacterium]|nr:MAG: transcriptional regulator [Candidatus Melainabacteria bacterium]
MINHPLSHPADQTNTTQDLIVLFIKKNKEVTVSELCAYLKITSMAVRRHLNVLQTDGLVDAELVRHGRGRPFYKYRLTSKAENLFPSGFQNLAMDLLDAIYEQSGHEGVLNLLTIRNKKRLSTLTPRIEDKSLDERVREVSKIFSEDGYMTEWEILPDGNYFIFQRHCAVHDVAKKYRQVCALEPQLMESLLGVKVTREKYMLKNDPVCGYLVHKS